MPQAPANNEQCVPKVLSVSFVLTLLFSLVGSIMVISLGQINADIRSLNVFLENAEHVKPNFEESLSLYTQGADEAIRYLEALRPDSEEEYIRFISSVESLGEDLDLNLNLESLPILGNKDAVGTTLNYRVQFFAGVSDLLRFLEGLEVLSYYVRVYDLNYQNFSLNAQSGEAEPNVDLTIQLYVK